MAADKEWIDKVELSAECYERVLVPELIPSLDSYGIVTGGIVDVAEHYLVSRLDAKVHVVLFSVKGQGKLTTEEGEVFIAEQTMVILPAGCAFQFELDSDFWQLSWLLLDSDNVWSMERLGQKSGDISAVVEQLGSVNMVYHLMNMIYYQSQSSDAAITHSDLLAQLEKLLLFSFDVNSKRDKSQLVREAFAKVQERLHVNWTVESIAELAHVSAPHFHRLCKTAYGQSPIQKLIELRMKRAQHFLLYSDWSVADIAVRVGYKDAFNFSNGFKRFCGVSPSQYRN